MVAMKRGSTRPSPLGGAVVELVVHVAMSECEAFISFRDTEQSFRKNESGGEDLP